MRSSIEQDKKLALVTAARILGVLSRALIVIAQQWPLYCPIEIILKQKGWITMRKLLDLTRLAIAGLILSALCSGMFAQDQQDKNRRDRMKTETSMTGCLNKDSAGMYTLTDEKTGVKTTVTGSSDLEKHSANHKVTLTGESKTDSRGKSVLEVSKIQHISASCKAQ